MLTLLLFASIAACQADDVCRLAARASSVHGVRVYVTDLKGDKLGMTIAQQIMVTQPKAVTILGRPVLVGAAEQFDVLCHELGHALQPAELRNTPKGEVFAELVSESAMRRLGRRKAVPLRELKSTPAREWDAVSRRYSREIDQIAAFIVDAMAR
jgi:predicted NBD/HSP70 family sugar kinase